MFAAIPFDTRSEEKRKKAASARIMPSLLGSHLMKLLLGFICGDFSAELYLYSLPFFLPVLCGISRKLRNGVPI